MLWVTNSCGFDSHLAHQNELKTAHMSQEKLARLADVANNTIIKIEAGKNQNPTLDTLKKIAKALGVSVDDLIQ